MSHFYTLHISKKALLSQLRPSQLHQLVCYLDQGSPTFLHRGPVTVWKKSCGPGGGGGWLDGVYSFILLSAHVEVDSSLVSERICDVTAALEKSFTFCMTAVKTFTGITIAQSLHVDFVISIGSPSWFKTEMFPVLRCNRKPPCICILNAGIHERGIKSLYCSCLKHVSVLVCVSGVCENSAQVTN